MTAPYGTDVTVPPCKDHRMDVPSVDERRNWAGRLGDDELAHSVAAGLACTGNEHVAVGLGISDHHLVAASVRVER
jgi:hypothetical protein